MRYNKLKKQLKIDEGCSHRVVEAGEQLIVGINHIINTKDPNWAQNLKKGDFITDIQIDDLFDIDLALAINKAEFVFESVWEDLSPFVKEAIVNICFHYSVNTLISKKEFLLAIFEVDPYKISETIKELDLDPGRTKRLSNLVLRGIDIDSSLIVSPNKDSK